MGQIGFGGGGYPRRHVLKTFNFLLAPKKSFVNPTSLVFSLSTRSVGSSSCSKIALTCPALRKGGTSPVPTSFYASFCHYAMSAMTLPTPRVFLLRLRNM